MPHLKTSSSQKLFSLTALLVALIGSLPVRVIRANDLDASAIFPILKSHCAGCHGDNEEVHGDVDLSELSTQSLQKNPDLLTKLVHVIEHREMPPEDAPQLLESQRNLIGAQLQQLLGKSAAGSVGHAEIRRMNRFQYNNAVTDLFDLNCVVFTLPERMMREHKDYFRPATGKMADIVTVGSRPLGKSQLIEPRLGGVAAFPQDLRAEHGYDNRDDHLSLSPVLMESFLKLGQSITQSPDFSVRRVGLWNDFFAPPSGLESFGPARLREEIQSRLEPLLARAFRTSIDQPVLNRYTEYAFQQIDEGQSFTDAMKAVAAVVISSPRFLYIYDTASESDQAQPLDDWELASRLSFFLWGSIPDSELLDLARQGRLQDETILSEQVDRMLGDEKLKRFCDSFPSQWLQLERIISAVPNRDRFPRFYFSKYRTSMHMMMEPLLLFETVLIENQSILQFIDSDFTYRSVLLQEAYGEPVPPDLRKGRKGGGVTVLQFGRLPVTDRRHGGVITNAAVMTMTSGPDESKPMTRGAWLATVIFGDPPDPPPADVPPLPESGDQHSDDLTLRERLEQHRKRADCRGCHEKIDPLGFALENYNPVGVWRNEYDNGRPVQAGGVLFRKHAFSDIVEFKDALLVEKHRFAEGLAGHLLSFALARQLQASDRIAARRIADSVAREDYKIHTLIRQIVLSEPFRNKLNPKAPGGRND